MKRSIDKKKYAAQSLMDDRLHDNIKRYEKAMLDMNRGITPLGENLFRLYSVSANIYNFYFRIMVNNVDNLKELDKFWQEIEQDIEQYIETSYNLKTNELKNKSKVKELIKEIDNFMRHIFWKLQRQNYFYYTISSSNMNDLVNMLKEEEKQ